MTSDQYREVLTTKRCPRCQTQFIKENMGMYGDSYGYKLDDAGFPYTLYALCRKCYKQTSFKELGIKERKNPPTPARIIPFPTPAAR